MRIKKKTEMKGVGFRLSERTLKKITREAKKHKTTSSVIVRTILDEYFKKEKK